MTAENPTKSADTISWQSHELTVAAIDMLEEQWIGLVANAFEKNIFLYPWFLKASLPLFDSKAPSVITIYEGNLLIGLMLVHQDTGYAKCPVRFYRSALHPHQFSATPLIHKGFEAVFAKGLYQWIDETKDKHSFLLITHLTDGTDFTAALMDQSKRQNRYVATMKEATRAGIRPKSSSSKNYDHHLSKNRRKGLRRQRKALTAHGDVKIEQLTSKEQLSSWLEDFMRVENSGWKKDSGTSIILNPTERRFYEEMMAAAFAHGILNMFRLCIDDKPIAYTIDALSSGEVYCLKCAHDHEYRSYAPGVLMEYETLKHYTGRDDIKLVDSCTDENNSLLNELWPDRKPLIEMMIARKGFLASIQIQALKLALALSKYMKTR